MNNTYSVSRIQDANVAVINRLLISKFSSIIDLSLDTMFVYIGALRAEILALKAQIFNLHPRQTTLCPKQILEARDAGAMVGQGGQP